MQPASTIILVRSVIGALLAALAVANFVTGRVLFGVLFAGLAVMNVVMSVYIGRRRSRFARRFPRVGEHGDR